MSNKSTIAALAIAAVALGASSASTASAKNVEVNCLHIKIAPEALGQDGMFPFWGQTEMGRKNHASITRRAIIAATSGTQLAGGKLDLVFPNC